MYCTCVCIIYTHTSVCSMCCSCISMCAHVYMCVVCEHVCCMCGVCRVHVCRCVLCLHVLYVHMCLYVSVLCAVYVHVSACLVCACYMWARVSYGLHVYMCTCALYTRMSLCAHIADTRVIIPQIKEDGTYLLYTLLPKIN